MSPAARPGPPLPQEALLIPLLDAAADVLRGLEPNEIPAALRPLSGFDRRGLTRSAARSQLARAVETDKGFRGKVVDVFVERDDVQAALDAWTPVDASKLLSDAAARDELPLVVSALFAARPAGWEFGLGVATEVFERRRHEESAEEDKRSNEQRVTMAERARRRAEDAREAMAAQLEKVEAELKEERRARRARDDEAGSAVDEVRAQIDQLETELVEVRLALVAEQERVRIAEAAAADADARADAVTSGGRTANERATAAEERAEALAARVKAKEERLAAADRRTAELERALAERGGAVPAPSRSGLDAHELTELDKVARVAAELARHLDALTARLVERAREADAQAAAEPTVERAAVDVAPPAPVVDIGAADLDVVEVGDIEAVDVGTGEPEPALVDAATEALVDDGDAVDAIPVELPSTTRRGRRRAQVRVPPGMLDDSVEAADAMVRTPGLAIVVDGYNISMLAWPDAPLAQQRERLCSALNELQLRVRCQVTVVFDGADVDGRPVRYPGLRVIFSKPGEEADAVVIEQVGARPLTVPVLVASSDGWVREHAEAEGAKVLSAATLLKVLRR